MQTTITIDVPNNWLSTAEIFRRNACGYWAYGLETESGEWFLYDMPEEGQKPSPEDCEAIRQGTSGHEGTLPPRWYRLDRLAVCQIFGALVRLYGEKGASEADASHVDSGVQLALLGSLVYG